MYIARMKLGYGWKRTDADLVEAGAERVYVDTKKQRPERTELLLSAREGDVILLLHYNDLGGTKPATDRLAARLAAKGVSIEVSPNSARFTPKGPAKFVPTEDQDAEIRAIWLDPWRPEADKMPRIEKVYGKPVKRNSLYYRYGSVDNPKEPKT